MKVCPVHHRSTILHLLMVLLGIGTLEACRTLYFRYDYTEANSLLHESQNLRQRPFLKAHMKNGEVVILTDTWTADTSAALLSGLGIRYDLNRNVVGRGMVQLPFDSIALFETNRKIGATEDGRLAALGILTAMDVAFGLICLTNPKACFGSCPTFYIRDVNSVHYADAEGFSSAVAPSLAYTDIDALGRQPLRDGKFSIIMKNEALETHCVKSLKLLTISLKEGQQAYHTPADEFVVCEQERPASEAMSDEGNITEQLHNPDYHERFSLADPKNLSTKETIYLNFDLPDPNQQQALVLHFRQTLMTTYFIYHALGYMGDKVSDYLGMLETNQQVKQQWENGFKKELGDIEVFQWDETQAKWINQGGFYETGPIAINKQCLPLRHIGKSAEAKLKLVLNKGLWRIDYAALTNLVSKATPEVQLPDRVDKKGVLDDGALKRLMTSDRYLISMPGDQYTFSFTIPASTHHAALFLASEGYYLEWMRAHWLDDKNEMKLYQMLHNPKQYLKNEAAAFKSYETKMETDFWNSRIDTKSFSYDDQ